MRAFILRNKEWLKIVVSIVVVAISTTWFMSNQVSSVKLEMRELASSNKSDMHDMESRLGNMINALDKRLTVVETVLIMQGAPIRALTQAEAPSDGT